MAYGSILGQVPIFPENPNTIATNVSYDNSGTSSAISSNNVQGAIDNLVTYVDNKQPTDLPWKLIKSVIIGENKQVAVTFPSDMQFLKVVYNGTTLQNGLSRSSSIFLETSNQPSSSLEPIGSLNANETKTFPTLTQIYSIIQSEGRLNGQDYLQYNLSNGDYFFANYKHIFNWENQYLTFPN